MLQHNYAILTGCKEKGQPTLLKKRLNCPEYLAEWTGLEPATPGVTGRYSNQLNYHSGVFILLVGAEGIEPPTFAL
jgi:hypothetical protein